MPDLSKFKTLSELAPLFSTSEEEMKEFVKSKNSFIGHAVIFKKNGRLRKIVYVNEDSFRHFLKKLEGFLYKYYLLHIPISVHGFVKGKSIITNAQQHTRKKIVINADIKLFYESIKLDRVKEVFLSMGFQENLAVVLAELVTVNSVLATGLSPSPTISNIVCLTMDSMFEKWAKERNFTYTRYADDITISSNEYMPSIRDIESIFRSSGFKLNKEKLRLYRQGGPQYVTGLTVVDKVPRLPKKLKRRIRLEFYYIKKYGFRSHFNHVLKIKFEKMKKASDLKRISNITWGEEKLGGYMRYVNAVEPKFAKKIWLSFPSK